jgi:hypothetical protein
LAIGVIASSSLRNDDITPAAFWVTNAYNRFVNNRVAGGTHFGFWYRMTEHPEGPSYDPNICPRKVGTQGDGDRDGDSDGDIDREMVTVIERWRQ